MSVHRSHVEKCSLSFTSIAIRSIYKPRLSVARRGKPVERLSLYMLEKIREGVANGFLCRKVCGKIGTKTGLSIAV